ncbi:triadin-like [Pectinophora gossypiella]|uniref:triadin-like n=1 Tax=Pectinophora gossypiella TaxID=13191 RepID=UPI00214E47C5|nr:triadin-like [Pectinophora gossypiella]
MAFNRSKSPIVRKVGALVENSRCYSSVGGDTSKSKIPTKRPDSGNKTRPTISNVSNVKSEKSPVRSPAPVKGLKGSASTQNNKLNPSKSNNKDTHNNAETKSGEPSSKIRLSTTKSTTSTNSSASQKDKKEKNAMNKENNSSRANSPKRQTPPKSPQVVKYNLRKPEQNIHDNPDRSKPVKPKRSVTLLKNTIQENAKRTGSDKVRPIPLFNRIGSPNHNNRGFRPQLEDIKSSFLLLNKKQNPANAKQKLPDVTKPKPISEEERRQKLLEVKKSFQSKGFFQDSKYDKIEGLNWITWK